MKTTYIPAFVIISVLGITVPAFPASTKMHDSSRHLYDRVMKEFKHGDYEAALAGFKFFIQLHQKSRLAANAHYWLGECQYRLGQYEAALDSFYSASRSASSPKLVPSELKIGQSFSKLGDHERARLMFDRIVSEYPNTAEAELARKAIDAMKAEIKAYSRLQTEPHASEVLD
jgi:tol-pal system protein YbgF